MKRVLLVEDDASIRRFVQLALEDLPLAIAEAPSLAAARAASAQGGFDLVITDLMLPDGHGLDWVDSLRSAGDTVPVLLFSAGVSGPVRQRAAALRVQGVLEKPVSMAALIDEVQRVVFGPASPPIAAGRPDEAGESEAPDVPEHERQAIAEHFAGQASLFRAFKASSLAQLQHDRLAGDTAVAQGDRAALRLLAHSLKTVLGLLGHPAASDTARELETLAARADAPWNEIATGWDDLRDRLPRA